MNYKTIQIQLTFLVVILTLSLSSVSATLEPNTSDSPIQIQPNQLTPSLMWNYTIPELSLGNSPLVGNMDDDPFKEIAIQSEGYLAVLNHDGSVLWENTTIPDKFIESAPVLGDIDHDDKLEIVISDYSNTIYAFNAEDGSLLWYQKTDNGNSIGLSIADVDKNGQLEVLASAGNHFKLIDGRNGITLWSHNFGVPVTIQPAVADFDDDGLDEIVSGNVNGNLTLLDTGGDIIWQRNDLYKQGGAPLLIDTNLDGTMDIVFGDQKGNIVAFNGTNGNTLWKTAIVGPALISSNSAADINNDGKYEIVLNAWEPSNSTYVLDATTGDLIWAKDTHDILAGSPTIAEISADHNGLEIINTGLYSGQIRILAADGSSILNYDYANLGSGQPVTLANLDADGDLELVTTGAEGDGPDEPNNLMVFDLGSTGVSKIYWQGGSGTPDFHRTSNIQSFDTDSDTLWNTEEQVLGTDPLDPDTDNDGIYDGIEVATGSSPLQAGTDNNFDTDTSDNTAGENTETNTSSNQSGNFIEEAPGLEYGVTITAVILIVIRRKSSQ